MGKLQGFTEVTQLELSSVNWASHATEQNGQSRSSLGPGGMEEMQKDGGETQYKQALPVSMTQHGCGRRWRKGSLPMTCYSLKRNSKIITQLPAATNSTTNHEEFLLHCTSHSQFHPSLTKMSNGPRYLNKNNVDGSMVMQKCLPRNRWKVWPQ